MNLNEQHVHHMAKRLHQAHSKLDQWREKARGYAERGLSTIEVGLGAFAGGVVEGKSEGAALFGHVPYNLLAGAVLLAAGHTAEHWGGGRATGDHINNVGNGVLAGYIASKGYAFGKRWHDGGSFTGALKGGGGAPALPPGPAISGEVSPAQMSAMIQKMEQAAGR